MVLPHRRTRWTTLEGKAQMKQAEDHATRELDLSLTNPDDMHLLCKIQAYLTLLKTRKTAIQQQIDALSNQGCLNATAIFKNNRYLVLITPMIAGKRDRIYIGKNPDAQTRALTSLQRFKHREILQEQLNNIDHHITTIRRHLTLTAADCRDACETIVCPTPPPDDKLYTHEL